MFDCRCRCLVMRAFCLHEGLAKDRVVASKQLLETSLLTRDKVRELLEYSRRSLQLDEWPLKESQRSNKQSLCCSARCEAELAALKEDEQDGSDLTAHRAASSSSSSINWWKSNANYRLLQSIYQDSNDSDAVENANDVSFEEIL